MSTGVDPSYGAYCKYVRFSDFRQKRFKKASDFLRNVSEKQFGLKIGRFLNRIVPGTECKVKKIACGMPLVAISP